MTTPLVDLDGRLQAKRAELAEIFEKAGPELRMDAAEVERVRSLNTELADLSKKRDDLADLVELKAANEKARQDYDRPIRRVGAPSSEDGYQQPAGQKSEDARERVERKSIGSAFVDAQSYKDFAADTRRVNMKAYTEAPELGFKATFTTSGATLTGYDRQPGMVLIGQQRLTVADLLAQGQTTQNTIRYVKEDTYTNAATTVAEGATKPEASWDTSEVDAAVRKIAVTSKVTDELFADFPAMRDYIDNRMRFMVAQTEETQLLTGDGNAPNLLGLYNVSGIQTQAKSTDPTPDAIYKAITKIRTVGYFEPDGVVIHPDDWTDIRLLRTADGLYIWGSPLEMGPERIWGLPVVVTTAATSGTGLVGAFQLGAQIFRREGIRVEATNSNEDDFKKNLIAIRAEERLALAVYRPKAFCTVTGI